VTVAVTHTAFSYGCLQFTNCPWSRTSSTATPCYHRILPFRGADI